MRFKVFSCVLILCLAVVSSVVAGDTPALQRISEHVYAYVDTKDASPAKSYGSNAGLVVGRDAALVVDTLISAKAADQFLADIRKVTDKPVKYVVNTHHHLDHAWGNCQFVKQGAAIVANENAKSHAAEDAQTLAHPEGHGLTAKDMEGTTLQGPTVTFAEAKTIDLGDVTVELRYPGHTHTNDSITAYVPKDKVLFVGDILFTHYHPFLAEGDLPHWQQVLGALEQTPAEKIIPGHGPVSSKADLQDMKTYLRDFDTQAQALCAGKSADDAPAIAQELIKLLPQQQRTELPRLVEFNLQLKYLPKTEAKK
jgi:cyclase